MIKEYRLEEGEIRQSRVAIHINEVFKILKMGKKTMGQISKTNGNHRSNNYHYLNVLIDMDLVEKVEEKTNGNRKSLIYYQLTDKAKKMIAYFDRGKSK